MAKAMAPRLAISTMRSTQFGGATLFWTRMHSAGSVRCQHASLDNLCKVLRSEERLESTDQADEKEPARVSSTIFRATSTRCHSHKLARCLGGPRR
jgi:hypothetical protein